jgi:hypothetical protein
MQLIVGGVKELDPSPEKPVTSARTPTERKRKRKVATPGADPVGAGQMATGANLAKKN